MEKITKEQVPFFANFAIFLVILFLNLNLPYSHDQWKGLGDPSDYITQSKIPFLSSEFFFTHPGERFFPRPFTVPLLYKIADANPDRIIMLQRYIHTLSCLFLVYALMLMVSGTLVRYLLLVIIWFFLSWWNILGWSGILLSESLSISLFFAWIASYLLLLKRNNLITLVIHMVLTLLLSFTRDTWPYLLLIFYALVLGSCYLVDKQFLNKARILLVFVLVLFFVQQRSAQVGQRYKLPLINSIFLRVLPNDDYGQWFERKGMPCFDSLKANYTAKMGAVDGYKLYADTSYTSFLDWTAGKGKHTYTWFLITHPAYTFFIHDTPEQKSRIWAHSLFYPGGVRGYAHLAQAVFPFAMVWMVLVLCGLLVILFLINKDHKMLFPPFVLLMFAANIVLSYNADAMEVERHMLFNQIVLHLLGFISLALLIDYILTGGGLKRNAPEKKKS